LPTPASICGGGQAYAQATSETAGELHNARRASREIHTGDLEYLGQLPGTRVEGERIASMPGVKPLLLRRSAGSAHQGLPLLQKTIKPLLDQSFSRITNAIA
jgi:hypothetical protein